MKPMQSTTSGTASPRYGLLRQVDHPYEEAVERVIAALKEQGFGILTEIDVKKTLKAKLDKDFTKYIILGACNPPLAYRALSAELNIGLLLPCNVDVYEHPETGKTIISAVNPEILVEVTGRQDLAPIAEEVRAKLTAALEAV